MENASKRMGQARKGVEQELEIDRIYQCLLDYINLTQVSDDKKLEWYEKTHRSYGKGLNNIKEVAREIQSYE